MTSISLAGKTALVTGATGGIGSEIAKSLKQAGARVIISGTKQENLDKLRNELGGDTIAIAANLADKDSIDNLISKAEEASNGAISVLVCNAGITKDGLVMRMKDEDFEDVLNVNLTSTFRLIRASLKGMMKARAGKIICITSVVGHMGNPGQANYCASKAGISGMARSIAQEVASRRITVNCVAPGFIETAMTDKLNQEQKERITGNIPLSRMGSASDVAGSVLFLASNLADYITGQTIHVNGGLIMQ